MSWFTSGQNDQNIRYWLADSGAGGYETKRAAIEALSPNYAIADGRNAGEKVITGYATDAEIASNSLDIGGAILDRVHNYVNPRAPAYSRNINSPGVSIRTNSWGDKYPVWGLFLQQPQAIPTTGIDRLVAWWKNTGTDTVLYVGQAAVGGGAGGSYGTRKAVADILQYNDLANWAHDPTDYTIIVLCGTLSRFRNEGHDVHSSSVSFKVKTGDAGTRTQVLSHPVDTAKLMGGCKLGSGTGGEDADWTDEGGGMWSISVGTIPDLTNDRFVMSNAGGTLRALTKKASSAAVAASSDAYFAEPDFSGGNDRVFVKLADSSNPKTTTFFEPIPVWPGIIFATGNTAYFDVYGVEFYQSPFYAGLHVGNDQFAFYACKILFATGTAIAARQGPVDEGTGQFAEVVHAPTNRYIEGCEIGFALAGVYDVNDGHARVPINTVVRDVHFHAIGALPADSFGVAIALAGDSHAISGQGFDGFSVINTVCKDCGPQTINPYITATNYTDPALTISDGAVTNGTFSVDSGWTKGGGATISGGVANLGSGASVEQAITIGAGFTGTRQVFKFALGNSEHGISVSAGTTSGATDIQAATTVVDGDQNGEWAISIPPPSVTTFFIKFTSATAGLTLDNVQLLTTLAGEIAYTTGLIVAQSLDAGGGAYNFPGTCKDFLVQHCLVIDPILGGVYAPEDKYAVNFNGDDGQLVGVMGRYGNSRVLDNRIEGAFEEGIRTKLGFPVSEHPDKLLIQRNVVRGARAAVQATGENLVNGTIYDTSWELSENDLHGTSRAIEIANGAGTANHEMVSDNNTIRTESFLGPGSNVYNTIAAWRAAEPAGDTYDPTSVVEALYTDTGSPTLTASGGPAIESTLTATLGADPDGATSSLSYQWFRNDELIVGAESATYAATAANGNAVADDLKCVVLGKDAEDKWFLVESNTLTLTDGGTPGPFRASVFAAGVIA